MMTKNRFFSLNEARRFLALGLPVLVTQIAQALNKLGVAVDPAVYTMEDAVRAILALRKKGGGASC